jgi:hypothetical protein
MKIVTLTNQLTIVGPMQMKTNFVRILFVLTIFVAIPSFACSPIAQDRYAHTKERVKEKFDRVDSVELMTLIDEKFVKKPVFNVKWEVEVLRATFRVDRVFKGNSKPGDIVIFDSTSTCARSAVRPNVFVPPGSKIKLRNHPREWLIYRIAAHQTADPYKEPTFFANEIQDSPMTQPINEARDEIKFLEELKAKLIQLDKP